MIHSVSTNISNFHKLPPFFTISHKNSLHHNSSSKLAPINSCGAEISMEQLWSNGASTKNLVFHAILQFELPVLLSAKKCAWRCVSFGKECLNYHFLQCEVESRIVWVVGEWYENGTDADDSLAYRLGQWQWPANPFGSISTIFPSSLSGLCLFFFRVSQACRVCRLVVSTINNRTVTDC